MNRYLIPAGAAGLLILISAYFQGVYSERWGKRPIWEEQKILAKHLMQDVPTTVGEWESKEIPVDLREMNAAGAVGYYSRHFYKKSKPDTTGVDVLIICGHPADMTIHTPEKCYVTSGYKETSDQEKYVVKSGDVTQEFYTDKFAKGDTFEAGAENVRVFWSFTYDGNWMAPTVPKLELMAHHAVMKIYARTVVPQNSAGRADESPANSFLSDFMPVLTAAVFPKEDGAAGSNLPAAAAEPLTPAPEVPSSGDLMKSAPLPTGTN
jgi:hypothetical protein